MLLLKVEVKYVAFSNTIKKCVRDIKLNNLDTISIYIYHFHVPARLVSSANNMMITKMIKVFTQDDDSDGKLT